MRYTQHLIAAAILAVASTSAAAQYTWQKLEAAPGAEYTWRKLTAASGAEYTWRKLGGPSGPVITISANTANLNVHTAAGSPAGPVAVTVVINPGIYVYSDGPALPALTTAGLAAGSTVTITNNGSILGAGGWGGNGMPVSAGMPGYAGGNAIWLTVPATIDNTSGAIFGGGGGGGAGGGAFSHCTAGTSYRGVGGSGGQGYVGGGAGTGTAAGNVGSPAAPGAAVPGGTITACAGIGGGGAGGAWGLSGSGGTIGSSGGASTGGAAGYAVRLNGNAVTWMGGNNAAQVKGSVM